VFEVVDRIDGAGTSVRSHADASPVSDAVRNLDIGDHHGRLADVLQRNVPPLLGQFHHGAGVDEAVAELVVILSTAAVGQPTGLGYEWPGVARHHHQVLHVSPGQAGVGLKSKGTNCGGYRSARRSSGVLGRADFVRTKTSILIDGDDALVMTRGSRGEGCGQGGAALFQVPRLEPRLTGAGNGQREDGVGVAVAVAVVHVPSSVSTGPHKDGAFPISSAGNPVQESSFGQGAGAVDGSSVVLRTPRSGVDVDVVGVQRQRSCFYSIVDDSVEHPDASDGGVVGDSDAANSVVSHSGDLSSAPGSMLIVPVVLRHRILIAVVDIRGSEGIVVLRQIRMVVLDPIVEDGDDDPLARVTFPPGWFDVHVRPVPPAPVDEPLFVEHRITELHPEAVLPFLLGIRNMRCCKLLVTAELLKYAVPDI